MAFALAFAFVVPALASAAEGRQHTKADLHIGFITTGHHGVLKQDATAALTAFARTVGVSRGYEVDVIVTEFPDVAALMALPESEWPHLINLNAWDFLETGEPDWLEPAFTGYERGRSSDRYLLLARQDRGIDSLGQLRGRDVNIYSAPNAGASGVWLEARVRELGAGSLGEWFSMVEYQPDLMAAALPVFFGSRAAVLIGSVHFELLRDLNPQMGVLRPVAVSEPLSGGIVAMRRTGWVSEQFRQDLLLAVSELHESAAGQQILVLLRVERLAPFDPAQLETLRALHERTRHPAGTHRVGSK